MLINFNQVLYDLNTEEPIKQEQTNDPVTGDKRPNRNMMLGDACVSALSKAVLISGKELSGPEKLHCYVLGASIKDAMKKDEPLNVKSEDIAMIKAIVAAAYFPAISGQAWLMLEKEKEE